MRNAHPQNKFVLLLLVCSVAFALRIAVAFAAPRIAHPDEIFQNLEQAHRLVYGYGIVPWEFRAGVRSWMLPAWYAGVFKISDLALPGPAAYLKGAAIFGCLWSLAPVACAFLWGWELKGARTALVAGTFVAVWFELIYFAPAALTEVIAAHLFIAGFFLGFPCAAVLSRARRFSAGVALGLALMLRIQLSPAIAAVALFAYLNRRRQSIALLSIGFLCAVAGAGILDWITWSYPWQSIWKYVYINIVEQRSHSFGVFPWYYYLVESAVFWSFGLVPIVCLVWMGARIKPVLGIAAVAMLLSHSAIAHKEYRFIYPAIMILVVLAGLGSARLLVALNLNSGAAVTAYLLIVTTTSGFLAIQQNYHPFWTASRGEILAFREIARDPNACGVVLWRQRGWTTPGYTGLHRDIPIYEAVGANASEIVASGNYLVSRTPIEPSKKLTLFRYFGGDFPVYLYRRKEACSLDHLSDRLIYPDWYGESGSQAR